MAITETDRANLFTPENRRTLEAARDLLVQIMPEFTGGELGSEAQKDAMLIGRTYHGLAQIIGYDESVQQF